MQSALRPQNFGNQIEDLKKKGLFPDTGKAPWF
jgi:hypothetical protein